MTRHLFGLATAVVIAFTANVAAQDPSQPTTPRTGSTAQSAEPSTVEGCLMKEEDVPGRRPNVAERAGIAEDYLVTKAKVVKGPKPSASSMSQPPASSTDGSAKKDAMFEVEGIDDSKLQQLVGKRVQIEGKFENVNRAKARPETETPADDVVEIRATTVREVPGDCQTAR